MDMGEVERAEVVVERIIDEVLVYREEVGVDRGGRRLRTRNKVQSLLYDLNQGRGTKCASLCRATSRLWLLVHRLAEGPARRHSPCQRRTRLRGQRVARRLSSVSVARGGGDSRPLAGSGAHGTGLGVIVASPMLLISVSVASRHSASLHYN